MASNINSMGIDEFFPIAGQDNDSQGFRDNFNIIKNSLSTAKTEITSLQDNSADTTQTNNFNNNIIMNANLLSTTEFVYTVQNATEQTNIYWNNGNYQVIQAGNDILITLSGWPTDIYGNDGIDRLAKLRLAISGDGNARTITFNDASGRSIRVPSTWPTPFQVTNTDRPKIVDFWTTDALVLYADYVGEFGT